MTDEEMRIRFEALKPGAADAIDLFVDACKSIQENALSAVDLKHALELCITSESREIVAIHSVMLHWAASELAKTPAPPPSSQ